MLQQRFLAPYLRLGHKVGVCLSGDVRFQVGAPAEKLQVNQVEGQAEAEQDSKHQYQAGQPCEEFSRKGIPFDSQDAIAHAWEDGSAGRLPGQAVCEPQNSMQTNSSLKGLTNRQVREMMKYVSV